MLGRGGGKHEVENLLSEPEASRVAGANAQPPEVWGAKLRGNVLQSVVTRIAAALLEAHASGQQVELVVNDKNGARQNFVVERERDDERGERRKQQQAQEQAAQEAISMPPTCLNRLSQEVTCSA